MPWKASTAMQEKQSFITEWLTGEVSVTELCREFGISRTLGHEYIRRFLQDGREGLEEQSRSPKRLWNKTLAIVERLIVVVRKQRRRYGAKKIYALLNGAIDPSVVPAISTIDVILKRNGLVVKRKRVRRIREVHPIFEAWKPNQIWSADFKGHFRMGNMRYCYPLTVMDARSRYVLAIVGMHRPTFEATKAVFEALFEEYGLPKQIHTDNGEPFASAMSLSRLTHLAVWFIELGIVPVYSDPGHPEHNASHERMHRELKAEATRPAAYSLGRQQGAFDAFRDEYNNVRPHEALDQRQPRDLYFRSAQEYTAEIEPWQYDEQLKVKYVCRNGAMRWGSGKWVTVSTTLCGKYIGLEKMAEGIWRVYFRNVMLGYLDEKVMRIQDDQGRLRRNVKRV